MADGRRIKKAENAISLRRFELVDQNLERDHIVTLCTMPAVNLYF